MISKSDYPFRLFLVLFSCLCYGIISGQDDFVNIQTIIEQLEGHSRNNPDSALLLCDSALKHHKTEIRDDQLNKLYYYQGLAWFNKNNYDRALESWKTAQSGYAGSENENGLASCYNSIGSIFELRGDYAVAADLYQKALKIYEKLRHKERMANSYNIMGAMNLRWGYPDEAEMYFKKAINILQSLTATDDKNIHIDLADANNNIANIYFIRGEFEKALNHFNHSIYLYRQMKELGKMASIYLNIGNVYLEQDSFNPATEQFRKGLNIATTVKDKRLEAYALSNIAAVLSLQNQFVESSDLFKQCIHIADSLSLPEIKLDGYLGLYENYLQKKQYEKALQYYRLFSELKDTLYEAEKHREIMRLQTQYESAKKEEQLQLSRLEIEKNKALVITQRYIFASIFFIGLCIIIFGFLLWKQKTKKQIAEINNELTLFRQLALANQMNPHFIFNALNSIQGYILSNDKIKSNEYLGSFAELMRKTLHNGSFQYILLAEEIDMLNLYLKLEMLRFDNGFEFSIDVDDKIDSNTLMVPPFIIQPFVENSIWHGLSNLKTPGIIMVSFKNISRNQIICTVQDNGVGREKAGMKTEKSKVSHKSKGTEITNERLRLINLLEDIETGIKYYDLSQDKNLQQGTRVEITIPYKISHDESFNSR